MIHFITEVRKVIKNISVRKLRANMAHVLRDVKTRLDRYVISRRGEPEAVIMCVDDYEGWLETLEIMSDKKAMADIRAAKRELIRGLGCSFEEVFKRHKRQGKKKGDE